MNNPSRFAGALLLLAATAVPAAAQKIVRAERLPAITLRDEAARPRDETRRKKVAHARRFAALPPMGVYGGAASNAVLQAATPSMPAPLATAGFASVSSLHLSPGDSSGAVGPNHVVGITNGGIRIHRRDGGELLFAGLRTFWAAAFGETGHYYDPRITYDDAHDRWIAVSIYDADVLFIAVSVTGDPTGDWTRYQLPNLGFIDFTHLALTRDTVVIVTYDDFSSIVLSARKDDLYGAARALTLKQYEYTRHGVAPVQAEESTEEYLLDIGARGLVYRTTAASSNWRDVDFGRSWNRVTVWAPQPGTATTLDTGFQDVENAVLRNGVIHVVQTVGLAAPIRTSVLWTKFNPADAKIVATGTVDDPSGRKFYAYPSIAVNRAGAMLVGFSTLSSTKYASAGYVYIDALGRVSSEGLAKAGEGAVTNSERWGDYTATVTDPLDENAFWTVQLYAGNDRWITWWSKVQSNLVMKNRAVRR